MEDIELKDMWNALNQNREEAKLLHLQFREVNNRMRAHLQTHKAQSKLNSLSTLKKWAVVIGILWVGFLGRLVYANHFQNIFFSLSALMVMVFTIMAIVVYFQHIALLDKVNYNESVVDAQMRITKLQTSTLSIVRILWLQMPFYTSFFWSIQWIKSDTAFWYTAFPVTLGFTILAIWLFRNISLKNVDKKWFKVLLSIEWSSLSSAKEYLDEIEEFKKER